MRFIEFVFGVIVGFILSLVFWTEFRQVALHALEIIFDTIYEQIQAYFKYVLFTISVIVGGVLSYLMWKLFDVNSYKRSKEKEIKELERKAMKLIEDKNKEAKKIIERAEEEAEYIRAQAYERGYQEGQERHKKELKSLRAKVSAVKSIFKTHPELNECFSRITGWDFEKWLKER